MAFQTWIASLLIGVALVVWIVVQVLVIAYMASLPLQLIYGLVGLAIVLEKLGVEERDRPAIFREAAGARRATTWTTGSRSSWGSWSSWRFR